MPEYTINLPEELIAIVKSQGYSVNDYIQVMLVNPLVKRLKAKMEKDALKLVDTEINVSLDKASKKVTIKESPLLVKK